MMEEKNESQLLELRLKNYKSVPGAILTFEPLTVLVGPNGAGKSNILDGLSLLSEAMSVQLRTALDARGGVQNVRLKKPGAKRAPRFGISVRMKVPMPFVGEPVDVDYGFEARAVADHGYEVSRERCFVDLPSDVTTRMGVPGVLVGFNRTGRYLSVFHEGSPVMGVGAMIAEPHALFLPVLSGLTFFSEVRDALASIRRYSISPDVIRDLHDPTPGDELEPDGKNIASVIAELQRTRPDDHRRLCEFLGRIVPGIIGVEAASYGSKRGLVFTQRVGPNGKPLSLEAASMSDGTLRVLGILAAVFQKPQSLVMAIEEPEATIHPGALGVLMDILRQGEHRSQIVITTHSPDVLDTPDLDPAAIKLVQWFDGVTSVAPIGPASFNAVSSGLATVGELLRSNFLRPSDTVEIPNVDLFP